VGGWVVLGGTSLVARLGGRNMWGLGLAYGGGRSSGTLFFSFLSLSSRGCLPSSVVV
jgi:hypothetical protein